MACHYPLKAWCFLAIIAAMAFSSTSAAAVTARVPADTSSIQDAIDWVASRGGGTVIVSPGTYYESITINKGVTVTSVNDDTVNTILDGEGDHQCVSFDYWADGAVLNGFTIRNGWAEKGGGICADIHFLHTVTITQCLVTENEAYHGGGLYAEGAVVLKRCAFFRNTAKGKKDDWILGTRRGESGLGGGVKMDGGILTVRDCRFEGNESHYGGAIYITDIWSSGDRSTVTNGVFVNNYAKYRGGGIFNGECSSLSLQSCSFTGNWTDGHKAGVDNFGTYHVEEGHGGAVASAGPSLVANDSTFEDNRAAFGGGVACWKGTFEACNFLDNSAFKIKQLDFWWNDVDNSYVGGEGGGLRHGGNSSLTHCLFQGNTADMSGGGLWAQDTSTTESIFRGNDVGTEHYGYDFGEGGGLYIGGGTNDIFTCGFENNVSHMYGGGVYLAGGTTSIAACDPDYGDNWDPQFTGNYAVASGGAVCIGRNAIADIQESLIYDNHVNLRGGGVYNASDNVSLYHVYMANNTSQWGGGLFNGAAPTIDTCMFQGNEATGYGGGLYNTGENSTPAVTNCYFFSNFAESGGGGMANWNLAHPVVENCQFRWNNARSAGTEITGGGALLNLVASATVSNCIFSDNTGWYGAAVATAQGRTTTVTNCTIINNEASYGGAFHVNDHDGSQSHLNVWNTLVWNNTATTDTEDIRKLGDGSILLKYSDVQHTGQWTMASPYSNVISGAPLLDANRYPTAPSPCIDSGYNSAPAIASDRIVYDGDKNGTHIIDIGAREYIPRDAPPQISAVGDDINEGEVATFHGTVLSPWTDRYAYTLSIDWGDGTAIETVTCAAGTADYACTHRYDDDPDTGTSYTVSVTATDTYGNQGTATAPVTVHNLPSTVSLSRLGQRFIVDRGFKYHLGITFSDPGIHDCFTIQINWDIDGGGNWTTYGPYAPDTMEMDVWHDYYSGVPSPDHPVEYTIEVVVLDGDGGEAAGEITARMDYHKPRLELTPVTSVITEGETARVAMSYSAVFDPTYVDPNHPGEFPIFLFWDDGTPLESFWTTRNAVISTSAYHTYPDDPPGDNDDYEVTASMSDGYNDVFATTTFTVRNVAPEITATATTVHAGEPMTVSGTIDDPGVLDTFTLLIDWDDTARSSNEYFYYPAGATAFSEEHTYAKAGTYVIFVGIADDDGGPDFVIITATVLPPEEPPPPDPVPGDLDDDGDVDGDDHRLFRSALGTCRGDTSYCEEADYDGDGCISYADYKVWYGYYRERDLTQRS